MTAKQLRQIDIDAYRDTASEAALMEMIRRAAILNGWLYYHPHSSKHSTKGYPDVTLLRDGVLIFAELKTTTGKVSPDQQLWLDDLSHVHKTRSYLWRPKDAELIVALLQEDTR